MGFRVPRTNELVIEWAEGHDYHGAHLRVSMDLPMKTLFRFQKMQSTEERGAQEDLMREFGDAALIEWNLEDDEGNPIPANGEGFLTQSFGFASEIFKKWAEAVQAKDADEGPLVEPSDVTT